MNDVQALERAAAVVGRRLLVVGQRLERQFETIQAQLVDPGQGPLALGSPLAGQLLGVDREQTA